MRKILLLVSILVFGFFVLTGNLTFTGTWPDNAAPFLWWYKAGGCFYFLDDKKSEILTESLLKLLDFYTED